MPNLLSKAYRAISNPLLPEVANSGAVLEQEISRPKLSDADSPMLAALRGFGAGAVKGAGHLAASYTSPLSIASLAAGPISRLAGMASPASQAISTGSRLEQSGFQLPKPSVMPSPSRLAELYRKFGMVDPSDTYSSTITDQMLNGR